MLYVTGINKTLDQFTYRDRDITELIVESFHEIDFIGVRGYTKFDESGNPSGFILISQQQGKCRCSFYSLCNEYFMTVV